MVALPKRSRSMLVIVLALAATRCAPTQDASGGSQGAGTVVVGRQSPPTGVVGPEDPPPAPVVTAGCPAPTMPAASPVGLCRARTRSPPTSIPSPPSPTPRTAVCSPAPASHSSAGERSNGPVERPGFHRGHAESSALRLLPRLHADCGSWQWGDAPAPRQRRGGDTNNGSTTNTPATISFSPDGRLTASGCQCSNGTFASARVWRLEDGQPEAGFGFNGYQAYAVAFSPLGDLFAMRSAYPTDGAAPDLRVACAGSQHGVGRRARLRNRDASILRRLLTRRPARRGDRQSRRRHRESVRRRRRRPGGTTSRRPSRERRHLPGRRAAGGCGRRRPALLADVGLVARLRDARRFLVGELRPRRKHAAGRRQ